MPDCDEVAVGEPRNEAYMCCLKHRVEVVGTTRYSVANEGEMFDIMNILDGEGLRKQTETRPVREARSSRENEPGRDELERIA